MTDRDALSWKVNDATYAAWNAHDGELLGIAATGRSVRLEGATFTLVDDAGMVIEDIHHVDDATLFRQLGVG